MDRQQLLELDTLLSQLLALKDAEFSKFLNSDSKETIKPFILRLQQFWSFSSVLEVDEISFGLHEKIFKFLLRLCPSFNSRIKKNSNSSGEVVLKAIICPKRFLESLLEPDPLGLLVYLFSTWNPSEYLDIIRDELIPDSLIKKLPISTSGSVNVNEFLKWINKNSLYQGPMKSAEKDSILRRFEYESDDDYFEEDNADSTGTSETQKMDPIQVILLKNYCSSPSTFSRTSTARKLPERLSLLKETKLSHEQIEGWALMLERNPRKSNIIQDYIIWQSKSN